MENLSNEEYNKKIDIELKKKELEKKYGTSIIKKDNISLELESEWLNHIEKIQQQFQNVEKITVWEYIGKPAYRKTDEIEPEKITEELINLSLTLLEQNIYVDAIYNIGVKELYRFITEEMFFHKINNIRIKGLVVRLIYEDFHPNAEHDITMAFKYFFGMTMAKKKNAEGSGYDLICIDTSNYKDSGGNKVDEEKVIESFNTFLDSFDYFEVTSNQISNICINENKTDAKLTFEIEYKGRFDNSPEYMSYKGNGWLLLKPMEYRGWDIYHVNLPGLKI